MDSPDQEIEAVLDESGPDYNSFTFERPTAGHQGEVFLVSLEYGGEEYEVVIKFQSGDPDFALEPFLHEYVADRTDVPVPRILIFQEEPDMDVDAYFVTERVSGTNLAEEMGEISQQTREDVVEHAGRILGDMHSQIGFEGYGRLALEDDRLIVDEFTWDWGQFFQDLVDRYIERLEGTPFDDIRDEARNHLDDAIGLVDNTDAPRLIHDDFRPANMLFDSSGEDPISAVLDWQFALAGEPEYHIARTDFLFIDPAFQDADTRDRLRERLYTGYREHRDFEPDDEYRKRRDLYYFATLLWRMAGFEAAFADFSELAKGRAEVRFRRQYDQLAANLPEP